MKGNIKQGQELEALINQITSIPMTVAIKEEDLDYLHQAKAILKRRIHSFPKDDEPRVDSVIRELEDFGMAKTEHSHPLGMIVSTHFRCGKGIKRGLKNGALPFNID